MEITDVSVRTFEAELESPKGISGGRTTTKRPAALVVVETDTGLRGIGEGYGPEPYIVETIVEEKFRPRLLGENPLDTERLWHSMVTDDTYWDRKGQGISAASGVDMALWDIAGKHHGVPVYELLGGDADGDGTLRAYASDLFWDDPETMAKKAAGYVDEGFGAVKAHLGRGLEADRERVRAINDTIGDAHLMVDMNCGYDRVEATRVGRMLESEGVYWYEEPLSPYDVDGYVELREELSVPIATGENEYTKWGFLELIRRGAADYVMPDAMRCGGITETKKICTLGEAFNTTVTPHSYTTGVGLAATIHTMASSRSCEWLEYDVTDFPLYETFLSSPLEFDDEGRVRLPSDPGLGVEIPDSLIEEYGTN